ncbi:MAG: AMP-binding protein, partial [Thermoguttaceae bacterium]|nr:AMP-binding protein [Thermoguttaceae bacterium]
EHEFPSLETEAEVDLAHIRPATVRAVNEMVEEQLGRPLDDDERQPQTSLDELGLDSLQRMDLALAIEDRFSFRSDRVADTLGELWALADGQASLGSESAQPAPKNWFRPVAAPGPPEVLAETIGEAFVRRALACLDDVAVADRLSGVLTYRRLLVGARLLSKRLRELPGDAVGVLLPASVAADLVYLALHLAGKLPVMLNWTTGPAGMGHGVEKTRLRRVVTSRRFVDRLGIEVPGAEYALLEDIRGSIGKFESLATLAASYVMPRSFLRDLPQPDVDAPAVVLFTSGSESAPKAVPLSHRNLIADSRASIKRLEAKRTDAILGFLPPFHSFGLTANIVAPLLAGVRVVHYPDPTNAAGLVQTTAAYRPTITITTPTFLGYQFSVARPEDLDSLRVIITGAEKCPEAIFERARYLTPRAEIIEGYGITECSPVVAGNIRGRTKPGTVGPPLDGVEIRLVDPETRQPLPMPGTGMLLVHGPTVFSGYMGYEGADPFMELDGKRWYVTGDLVEVDED